MSDPELKPCPFCGGDDFDVADDYRGTEWVVCLGCYARGPQTVATVENKCATQDWNTRAGEK